MDVRCPVCTEWVRAIALLMRTAEMMTRQLLEATALLGAVRPASQVRHQGVGQAARTIIGVADRAALDRYWIHQDVDILDPSEMPAVDSLDPGDLSEAVLADVLAALAPRAVGAQVTVFGPSPHRHHRHRPRPARPRPSTSSPRPGLFNTK